MRGGRTLDTQPPKRQGLLGTVCLGCSQHRNLGPGTQGTLGAGRGNPLPSDQGTLSLQSLPSLCSRTFCTQGPLLLL